MASLKTVQCPNCGGNIELKDKSEHVSCRYCGTTSFLQRKGARPPGAGPVIVVQGPSTNVAIAISAGVAVVAGVVAAVFLARPEPYRPPPPAPITAPPLPALATPTAVPEAPKPRIRILTDRPLLLSDVNGDQQDDVVASISYALGDTTSEHYASFDGNTGELLAKTPALEDLYDALPATVGGRLLLARKNGQVDAFDLSSGHAQWTTTLGDTVARMCSTSQAGSVYLQTRDEHEVEIDLTTGRQIAQRAECKLRLTPPEGHGDPRDRRDYRAPDGVPAYRCGGVTVMGSQNYSVSDQCLVRARIDTDRLDGMIGHSLWKVDDAWLVLGIRSPGSYVPMVGLIQRGKFVWKQEVPKNNPLEAEQAGPHFVAMAEGKIFIAYKTGKAESWFVTSFDVADGVRRYAMQVASSRGVHYLSAKGRRVFVAGGDTLQILHADNGVILATIGS